MVLIALLIQIQAEGNVNISSLTAKETELGINNCCASGTGYTPGQAGPMSGRSWENQLVGQFVQLVGLRGLRPSYKQKQPRRWAPPSPSCLFNIRAMQAGVVWGQTSSRTQVEVCVLVYVATTEGKNRETNCGWSQLAESARGSHQFIQGNEMAPYA